MFGIILNNTTTPDRIAGWGAHGETQTFWRIVVKGTRF
jgi:hypothetical protein